MQAEHDKAAEEAAELQKQQDALVLAAVPSAMPKDVASQVCRARAALELTENLGKLLVGDTAGPYKAALDALVAAAKADLAKSPPQDAQSPLAAPGAAGAADAAGTATGGPGGGGGGLASREGASPEVPDLDMLDGEDH